jgi:hypothetical protein
LSRTRFDDLWRYIRWSEQPSVRKDGMSSEKYRWLLVDNFVQNFNNHRAFNFNPFDLICGGMVKAEIGLIMVFQ